MKIFKSFCELYKKGVYNPTLKAFYAKETISFYQIKEEVQFFNISSKHNFISIINKFQKIILKSLLKRLQQLNNLIFIIYHNNWI